MESMDELISQAADFISSLLPFLNNINIVGLILSFVSLVLSVLLCFWGYRLFTCFTAGIGFVTGAFLGFLLSGHYFTDELWIILLSALILGLILGFLATRLILLSTFFVVLILVSVFSCGLLVSLSNVMAGIISLILGIVAGVICIKLQKPIIILVTAFCGALGTVQILFQLLKFEQITIFYGAFLSLAMIGSIVQFLSTRRDA